MTVDYQHDAVARAEGWFQQGLPDARYPATLHLDVDRDRNWHEFSDLSEADSMS